MMPLKRWLDFLFPPRADERAIRDISIDAFLSRVALRRVPATHPDTRALLPFSDTLVRAAIHEAKYHGNVHALDLLAAALAEYLRDPDDILRNPVIVPIPLGTKRYRERGMNQAEEVARQAIGVHGIGIDSSLLTRVRETVSQVSLPRQAREENMRGAFAPTRRADPSSTYILLDDVVTTGATMQAAIDALQEAGAKDIIPLALAH